MNRWRRVAHHASDVQTDIFTTEERIQPKPKTSAYKVLKALQNAGHFGLLNWQLQEAGGLSWHRRIGDLRTQGHNITTVRVSKGQFRYILESK